ncbi:unnamed protein product [Choristocarpus tenellus]
MSLIFTIVGRSEPLYEAELGSGMGAGGLARVPEESAHLNQFIIHSALDMVDRKQWATPATHLKSVDRFNDQIVSAFLTAGGIKFMLLHDVTRSDESVRSFFSDVHEIYVKLLMNPFYIYDSPIFSLAFDQRVKGLAQKYF